MDVDHEPPTGTVRYLSLAWLREMTREAASKPELASLASEHPISVTQVVTDGPEGDVTYHLEVADGRIVFGPGPADPEDVRMQQSWATATAVATGELDPKEAFLTGRVLLSGDRLKLLAAQPVFGALDPVFSSVRARTGYE